MIVVVVVVVVVGDHTIPITNFGQNCLNNPEKAIVYYWKLWGKSKA